MFDISSNLPSGLAPQLWNPGPDTQLNGSKMKFLLEI
jgi:hypothetical protein